MSVLEEERFVMDYDVVIVGGGPAGLSTAIRLKQLEAETGREISVCVLEKAAEIGAHILSGNVFEPRALNELFPDWKEMGAPLDTPALNDTFSFLTSTARIPLPNPPMLHNEGNYITSLGHVTRWLGEQAEGLGVEIYPGFAGAEVLYDDDGAVAGVATGDVGIGKDGEPKDTFARGMELRGRQTVFAEGCRGSCSEEIMDKFNLREGKDPQSYGIGIKEVWEIPEENCKPGQIEHTLGWPLDSRSYGGTFLYHMAPNKILTGFVIGLSYPNPYVSPYEEFQRWKTHPTVAPNFKDGKCIAYGARCINEGGFQAIPKLSFPGGVLVGCSAGFVNVPKVKGTHTAMKSGMVAAEGVFAAIKPEGEDAIPPEEGNLLPRTEVTQYQTDMENSWVWDELKAVRNAGPAFAKGQLFGMAYSGLTALILKGREPWTFHHTHKDWEGTEPSSKHTPIDYAAPDGELTFDLLTNLQRSGTNHEDDQPAHLKVKPELAHVPKDVSYQEFAAPESRFCPARVYEYNLPEDGEEGGPELVINAQNCVHCKCCSIKTPHEFIKWTVPEGGGGPAYDIM